jgi:sec-independent protein translocase protein TatA
MESRPSCRKLPVESGSIGGRGEVCMFEGLFQPMHMLVILFIALLIFGPSKLADLGKGLGDGIRNFKSAIKDGENPPPPPTPPAGEEKK